MVICIQKDQKRLLTYTEDRVAKIKTIIGCHWYSKHKYWTVPDTAENLEQLFRLFKNEQVVL